METTVISTSFDLQFTQIAWVVKDLNTAERIFREAMGIHNFSPPEIIRLAEFEGTHYGEPSEAESLVSIAYTGEIFIELIQPLSGRSIFQDYLDKNPAGGVQHIAYSLPEAKLDECIADMANKGFQEVTSVNHPIARIVFFDTSKDTGVFTEIMGITAEGEKAVKLMKSTQLHTMAELLKPIALLLENRFHYLKDENHECHGVNPARHSLATERT